MKAFEKWFENNVAVNWMADSEGRPLNKTYMEFYKWTVERPWKAALKEVVNQLKTNNDIHTSDDLVTWINGEIEND